MASLSYWDGYSWRPVSSSGPAGPTGADGKSVNVYGPQIGRPTPERKGDVWLVEEAPAPASAVPVLAPPAPEPTPAVLAPPEQIVPVLQTPIVLQPIVIQPAGPWDMGTSSS